MGNNFLRLKEKIRTNALIKGGLLAATAAMTSAAVYAIILKLLTQQPSIVYCLLIALIAGLPTFGIYILFTLPRDRRLARRLDSVLSLDERVETMVEFDGDTREMVELQRRDADGRLEGLTLAGIRIKPLLGYVIAAAVSVALLISAVLIPTREAPPPDDPDYNIDSWQETSLKNLIAYVRDSAMVDSAKDTTVGLLESLLSELKAADKVSQMKNSVIDAIVEIDAATDEVNSYFAIHTQLALLTDERIGELAAALSPLGSSALPDAFDDLRELLGYDGFAENVPTFTAAVCSALAASGYPEEDMLRAAIASLMDKLDAIAEDIGECSESSFITLTDASYATAASEINAALRQQSTNSSVCEYTILKLLEIFEISQSELPDLGANGIPGSGSGDGDGDGDDEGGKKPNGGGYGSGDAVYGSDDAIYDPDTGTYRPYGEVLNKYYAVISELIVSGELTEEQIEYVNEYFAILFDGSQKQD